MEAERLTFGTQAGASREMQAISIPTIYAWINRWRKGGIEAWPPSPAVAGRPKRMPPTASFWAKCWRKNPLIGFSPAVGKGELGHPLTYGYGDGTG